MPGKRQGIKCTQVFMEECVCLGCIRTMAISVIDLL